MPYIESKSDRRQKLQKGEPALTAGELNYQIFYYIKHQAKDSLATERVYYVIKNFVEQFLGKFPNYQKYNDMTGCLIRCSKEIERRLNIPIFAITDDLMSIMESYDKEIAKYEDKKTIENGDVE